MKLNKLAAPAVAAAMAAVASVAIASGGAKPFLSQFNKKTDLATTVPPSGPAKGDQNPYGVAVVQKSVGKLVKGDVLVSNFNNKKNQQGTGKSIVQVSPGGHASVFSVVPPSTASKATGLTTALVELPSGWVIVGNLPAPGGKSAHMTAGALNVIDSMGKVVKTIKAKDINGPWDMTAIAGKKSATLFVTNVLNGTVKAKGKVVMKGTVDRIGLKLGGAGGVSVTSNQVIGKGFGEHTDPAALVVGPTGVGLGKNGTLYVADAVGNRIAAIPQAMTRTTALGGGGMTVSSGKNLNDPLGLAIAPNGDVITMNGGDGKAVETTPSTGKQFTKTLVPKGAGDLFGAAIAPMGAGLYWVNDIGSGPDANSLELLH
jgi:hypothetical protein